MARFLIEDPEHNDPESPVRWECLEPSCAGRGPQEYDLDRHAISHGSEVVEVFTSRWALEAVLAEEAQRALQKIRETEQG